MLKLIDNLSQSFLGVNKKQYIFLFVFLHLNHKDIFFLIYRILPPHQREFFKHGNLVIRETEKTKLCLEKTMICRRE